MAGDSYADAAAVAGWPKDVVEHLLAPGFEVGDGEDAGEPLDVLRWARGWRSLFRIA